MANPFDQLRGSGLLGDSLSGLGQLGNAFGHQNQAAQSAQDCGIRAVLREQQMHAQQQINEMQRHMLDAQMLTCRTALKVEAVDMAKVPDELLTIREILQRETDKWLSPVAL